MLKDLFKGSLIYGCTPFIPRIISVLLLPILTKYLTPTDYGIYGTIAAINQSISAFSVLGLQVVLPNYFYKCPFQYKFIWREIYGFLNIWMLLFALIQAFILFLFIPNEAEPNRLTIILLSTVLTVFFGPVSLIGSFYYQLSLKPGPVAARALISGILTILINYICVVYYRMGYLGSYIGTFAGSFIVNASYWYVVNVKLNLTPIYNFKWRTINSILRVSIPTIPHYYSFYLLNSTNVVAMNYHDLMQKDIGSLTMSKNISGITENLLTAINQVVGPLSLKYMKNNNSLEMGRLIWTYLIMTYSITISFSIWAREVYQIFISNEELRNTYHYLIIFIMALNYRPVYVNYCNYFFFYEKTKTLMYITFSAGTISSIIYFIIIPYCGIGGALLGYYIGCIILGYSGYYTKVYKKHAIFNLNHYLAFFIQLVLTCFVYICVDFDIEVKMIISLIIIVILAFLFIKKVLNCKETTITSQ